MIRRTIRLKYFDYSIPNFYFVTICTQNRKEIFGSIVGAGLVPAQMVLNKIGEMVKQIMINYFKNDYFCLDTYQIMPNHIHLIIVINPLWATTRVASTLGQIIGQIKSLTTIEYIKNVKKNKFPPFKKNIWQRNYYERIIRNEKEFIKIKNYIKLNPDIWYRDRNNSKYI